MQNNQLKKKILFTLIILMGIIFIGFLTRCTILKAMANFLIIENEFSYVENAFVLSGGAMDRGSCAASLFIEKKVDQIWCTGGNLSPDLRALGIDTLESEITKRKVLSEGVPHNRVTIIPEGTSTLEEALVILQHCKTYQIDEFVIVSSKFHTKRIYKVFTELFKDESIDFYIIGAPSSQYNEEEWWKSEEGLIALNNEYLKLFYYSWKY